MCASGPSLTCRVGVSVTRLAVDRTQCMQAGVAVDVEASSLCRCLWVGSAVSRG